MTDSNNDPVIVENISVDDSGFFLDNLFSYLDLSRFNKKEIKILEYRLHFANDNNNIKKYTLEEIAQLKEFNVTRERVRQIEKRLLNRIKRLIQIYLIRNPDAFNAYLIDLNNELKNIKIIEWPREAFVIATYNQRAAKYSKQFLIYFIENFVLTKSIVKRVSLDDRLFLITPAIVDNDRLNEVLKSTLKEFKKFRLPEVKERQIHSIPKDLNFDEKIIVRKVVADLTWYSYISNGIFVKEALGLKEIAYRVLDAKNEPMHFSEIYEEAKKYKDGNFSLSSLHNALAFSEQIHPSDGQGMYSLKKWGNKVYSIDRFYGELSVDSLIETFLKTNGPQTYDEIQKYVLKHRRASDFTIRQGLGRLGCRQNREKKYYWIQEKITIERLIIKLLKDSRPKTINEIYAYVKRYGYSKTSIYARMNMMGLKKDNDGKYFI